MTQTITVKEYASIKIEYGVYVQCSNKDIISAILTEVDSVHEYMARDGVRKIGIYHIDLNCHPIQSDGFDIALSILDYLLDKGFEVIKSDQRNWTLSRDKRIVI